jgi:hypothetical protein
MTAAPDRVLIDELDLAPYRRGGTLADAASALLAQQRVTWELLRKGYASLETVQTRVFEFDGFEVKVQFNPGRLTSSSAKVDEKSISERPCFLCHRNLPADQRGIRLLDDYVLLCNPFPIFPEHFTIAHIEHRPQRILPSFQALLECARMLAPRYTIVYNGPKCGASAPDHFHLQAGLRAFMPFERELRALAPRNGHTLIDTLTLRAFTLRYYLRTFIAFQSAEPGALIDTFSELHAIAREVAGGGEDEPMINVLCWFDEDVWTVAVFARAKHRPSFYFAEGDAKLLLSPAAVDVGGVCTLPIERDFRRITRDHIVQMFEEISMDTNDFDHLTKRLRRS